MFTKSLNKMDMRIDQISFPAILVLIAGLCYLYRLKIPHEHFGKTVYTSILEVAGLFYWEIVSVCWKLLRDWSVLLGVCVCTSTLSPKYNQHRILCRVIVFSVGSGSHRAGHVSHTPL